MMMFIAGLLVMSLIATISMFIEDNDIVRIVCAGPIGWLSAIGVILLNKILFDKKGKPRFWG